MKKFLTVFLIILAVLFAGVIVCMILTMSQNANFGEFMVAQYAELTGEYGHTVPGFYRRLTPMLITAMVVISMLAIVSGVGLYVCNKSGYPIIIVEKTIKEERAKEKSAKKVKVNVNLNSKQSEEAPAAKEEKPVVSVNVNTSKSSSLSPKSAAFLESLRNSRKNRQ